MTRNHAVRFAGISEIIAGLSPSGGPVRQSIQGRQRSDASSAPGPLPNRRAYLSDVGFVPSFANSFPELLPSLKYNNISKNPEHEQSLLQKCRQRQIDLQNEAGSRTFFGRRSGNSCFSLP